MPEPDLNKAERHTVPFGGGMMGMLGGRDMMRMGRMMGRGGMIGIIRVA